jgi:hypothetical protein
LFWNADEPRRKAAPEYWKKAWLLDTNFFLAEDNFLAAREGVQPKLEIVDLKNQRNQQD